MSARSPAAPLRSALRRASRLLRDRRGALAPIAAIVALVLVVAAGASVDIGRAARDRALLQDIADSAAVAGASQSDPGSAINSATAYVNAALAAMSDKPSVTPTYTPASQSTYDNPPSTGVPFTVTLSGTMATSLTAMVMKTLPLNVHATATSGLVNKVNIDLSHFNSSAVDTNTIYAFGYNPLNFSTPAGLYKFAPSSSNTDSWTCVFSNKTVTGCPTTTQQDIPLEIPYADSVAFALSNTTGTSVNCYGLQTGANTMYYSTRLDSSGAYHDLPASNINFCGYAKISPTGDGVSTTIDDFQPVVVGSDYSNECYDCLATPNYTTTYSYNTGYGWQSCTPEPSGSHKGQCAVPGRYGSTTYVKPTASQTISSYTPPAGASWNYAMKAGTAYVYPQSSSRNPLTLSPAVQACDGSSVTYSWDDNGGGSDANITSKSSSADDDDHNDVDFTVTCTKAVSRSGAKLTG